MRYANWHLAMQWIDAQLELSSLNGTATELSQEFQEQYAIGPFLQKRWVRLFAGPPGIDW